MLKKIIVTGGDGRFASELKKFKTSYKFFFLETKNNLIYYQCVQLKITLKN